MGTYKYNIQNLKDMFNENGCVLLSNNYINNMEKLDFICKCGQYAKISVNNFRKVKQCKICSYKNMAKNKTKTQQEVAQIVASNNCKLISEYTHINNLIEFECNCKRIAKKTLSAFKKHPYCQECGQNKCVTAMNKAIKRQDIEQYKYELKLKKSILAKLRNLSTTTKPKKSAMYEFGYDAKTFQEHLKQFKKSDQEKMVIDHIFPFIAFMRKGIYDLKIINHLSNIQLLTDTENRKKGQKYDNQKFEEWLKQFDEQRKETHA